MKIIKARRLLLVAPLLAVLLGASTCEGDQCTTAGEYHYREGKPALKCVEKDGQLRWQEIKVG